MTEPPPLHRVRHRFVDVGDVRLHVAEAGDGPPLLLVHGWPQHWWCWRRMIAELAQSHRVLVPDLRGFGWSDAPAGEYAKATFAADLLALMDAEALDRVQLIGHDWGAYACFLLALEHPQRVDRLVALDIAPPWSHRSVPKPRHLALAVFGSYQVLLATPVLGAAALQAGSGLVRTLIRAGSGPDARWTEDTIDMYASVLRQPARARASAACYRTFLTRELPAALARGDRSRELDVPALLVMGEASPIRRVLDPRPQPGVRVEVIPRAGHFLPEEAPEQVLWLAGRWLGGSVRQAA